MMFEARAEFEGFLAGLSRPEVATREEARKRQTRLTKPPGSLGALEDVAVFLAG